MTSSSGQEQSYESEKLKGSIFTYHLVTGLYGEADGNRDGLVTIDELYQYVYAQTKFMNIVTGQRAQNPVTFLQAKASSLKDWTLCFYLN